MNAARRHLLAGFRQHADDLIFARIVRSSEYVPVVANARRIPDRPADPSMSESLQENNSL